MYNNAVGRVLIVGASDGGEMMGAILAETYSGVLIDFVDDNEALWETGNRVGPVLPGIHVSDIKQILHNYTHAFVGVGLHKLTPFRERVYNELKYAIPLINIIHPSAYISETAIIGEGNYFGAFSYVGPYTVIGDSNFFSSNTMIEHHCTIGNLSSWGPSVSLSGMCTIGSRVCMGTGIGLTNHVTVGDDSVIASGVNLYSTIKSNSIVRKKSVPGYKVYKFPGWDRRKK